MHTQRTIMIIVGAVTLVALAAAAVVIWWLGWVWGTVAIVGVGLVMAGSYGWVVKPWHTGAPRPRRSPGTCQAMNWCRTPV